jgi:hypothetical protein
MTGSYKILHMSLYSLEDFSGIRMLEKLDNIYEIHTLILFV